MPITLTLLTIAVLSTLFYGQVPEQALPLMKNAALALPVLLLMVQILRLLRLGKTPSATSAPTSQPAPPQQPEAAAVSADEQAAQKAAVLQLLSRLQEKGRLVDFIMDDMTPYADEQVGAAARIVHQGCREVLADFFTIVPIHPGLEEEGITLAENFDSNSYRLVGKVPEQPPYDGIVVHRGWKTRRLNLPALDPKQLQSLRDEAIIAPAEVEID
ncbi:MAG: DUF2760 domain-containing protein [Desulfuromonadaceae bacterium]|nr:DUF2760 domain-containing protein [Desulfuromonadaceae bacterium]